MSAAQLRAATGTALEGQALNHAQHRALFDPSPECDSLAERIVALHRHDVPATAIRGLLADIRAVLDLNAREDGCHRQIAGELDRLTRIASSTNQLAEALTVRGLVRRLRDPLTILLSPEQATAAQLVNARDIVRETIAISPRDRLASTRFAHELGGRRHRRLLELMGETA